jgi:hypothetical protein
MFFDGSSCRVGAGISVEIFEDSQLMIN